MKSKTNNSQLRRVIAVAEGREWKTLIDIQQEIRERFGSYDIATSISARLRDVKASRHNLVKEKRVQHINHKNVYFYRLVPAKTVYSDLYENNNDQGE